MDQVTKLTSITKGHIITDTATGRRYTALSSKAWDAGTLSPRGEVNHVIMVRPIHVGRAFDLFITQGSMDRGAYTVTTAAK